MTLPHANRDVPDSPLARWDARWKLAALVLAAFGIAALDGLFPSLVALGGWAIARRAWRGSGGTWVRGRLGLFALAALPFLLVLPVTLHTDGAGLDDRAGPRFRARARRGARGVRRGASRSGASRSSWSAPRRSTRPSRRRSTEGAGTARAHRRPGLPLHLPARGGVQARAGRAAHARLPRRGDSARLPHASGHVTGAVLVRGADRAERVADAMRCRGFDGTFHTTAAFRTTRLDVLAFAALVCATMALLLWDRWGLS